MDVNRLSEFLTDAELSAARDRISKETEGMTPEEMAAFALGVRLASVFVNIDKQEQIKALSACLVALRDYLPEV